MIGPSNLLYPLLLCLALCSINFVEAASNQGCILDATLCDADEACVRDGLFGQCYSDAASPDSIPPIILEKPLTDEQKTLLRLELERLADENLDWRHDKSQCVLAYFKLSISYELNYDTEFCSVRNPGNILMLIQRIETYLSREEEKDSIKNAILDAQTEDRPTIVELPSSDDILLSDSISDEPAIEEALVVDEETGDAVPVLLVNEELVEEAAREIENEEPIVTVDEEDEKANDTEEAKVFANALAQLTEASMAEEAENKEKRTDVEEEVKMSSDEEKQLKQYINDILTDQKTSIHKLTTPQLEKLITFIGSLQENLENTELKFNDDTEETSKNEEQEEAIPLTSINNEQQLLLKKDAEKFSNEDMGLANTEHKIVKGDVQVVEGNRVYIKIGKENITEDELYKLITFLDKKIADPNNLYFNDFLYEDGQLSFHISRLDAIRRKNDKRVDSASRVAQAVYKRRKDIQTLAGVNVAETGIGSGEDVVPVETSERDWLFLPILTICAFTITSLVVVLAVHMYRNRRRSYKSHFPEVIDHLEGGKASTTYEELCRQRMSSQDVPIGVTVGKSSSTSSWPDETLLQSCNLDISTGHVILSFLQEYLDTPEKIADQWNSVADYTNTNAETTIAERVENKYRNVDQSVLPYDENIVVLSGTDGNQDGYINASKIFDSDLRQISYIATQSPLESTVVDFWQCVWEQGITLIVNLNNEQDVQKYKRYWPDEGAQTYGIFEVHLVSEHIWSETYLVRSFYLKNTDTGETRTVTQFHYLAWPADGTPASIKSLLEFRRKVNKSYRGRASPVLVHCSNGAARTGTYCLIDIVVNRITKGVKEMNVAGTLEHLRDQRMGLVGNLEQYKLVFTCVAEEVNVLLKNLQQQQQ